jgi:hypothetical protein
VHVFDVAFAAWQVACREGATGKDPSRFPTVELDSAEFSPTFGGFLGALEGRQFGGCVDPAFHEVA